MAWRCLIVPPRRLFWRPAAFYITALFLLTVGVAVAEPVFTVRMKGYAEGIGLHARSRAVADAQHQAMVDVLQAMTNTTEMAPFRALLRETSRYVQRYDLLRTDVIEQTTEVEIDVHILERSLRHDIATIMLPRLPRKPVVLLLIAEYIGHEAASGGPTFHIAEAIFRERIKEFEFSVRGIHQLVDHYEAKQLLTIINGDVVEAAAFARANQADVVLIGSASTTHEPVLADSNMMRNRATVVLRAFAGTDGKMTDIMTAQAVVQGVDSIGGGTQAVEDACGKLVGDSVVAIVLTMLGLEDESRVIIEVTHPRTLETLESLAKLIGELPRVVEVETLFFSESQARLAVEYSGSMAAFSDNISGRSVNGKRVEVTRSVKREMTLTLH